MKDDSIKKLIAARLKEARQESGMSQADTAELLDKVPAAFGMQERGVTNIAADEIFACSIMFGIPIKDLFPSPQEIPQAFKIIYEQKRKEKAMKRKQELLAELEKIEKSLAD